MRVGFVQGHPLRREGLLGVAVRRLPGLPHHGVAPSPPGQTAAKARQAQGQEQQRPQKGPDDGDHHLPRSQPSPLACQTRSNHDAYHIKDKADLMCPSSS